MKSIAYLVLLTIWGIANCTAAFAGAVPTPELDGGTLTALVSGISSVYVGYRVFRARRSK